MPCDPLCAFGPPDHTVSAANLAKHSSWLHSFRSETADDYEWRLKQPVCENGLFVCCYPKEMDDHVIVRKDLAALPPFCALFDSAAGRYPSSKDQSGFLLAACRPVEKLKVVDEGTSKPHGSSKPELQS